MTQKDKCPVCTSASVSTFLIRKRVPVHQNLLFKDRQSAIGIARGDLDMAVCHNCGFVFNRAFDATKLSYGLLYDNTQEYSGYFTNYLDNLAHSLVFEKGVRDCQIIEVGCGNGSFLKRLVADKKFGNRGYGFDPSYTGPLESMDGRLQFKQSYYGEEDAAIRADVVICRHVIEHIAEPVSLLRIIRQALADSSSGRLFLETPCASWILRNQVIWDLFYEHCSLFTAESIATAVEAAGFQARKTEHVFGGSYLFLEAYSARVKLTTLNPHNILQLAGDFTAAEERIKINWQKKVRELAAKGKVAIWGAGAKGATLANLVDPAGELIDCVVDLNPQKQGKYLPGTGHCIVSPQEIGRRKVSTAILMNPNYREEISFLLQELRLEIELLESDSL